MNKTIKKDIIREIKSNIGRFLSIMSLLFIAGLAFTGVYMSAIMIEKFTTDFFDDVNMYDIKVVSTLGLDYVDETITKNNEYIEKVEGVKTLDVFIKDTQDIVRIGTMPKEISTLLIKEGRLPKNKNEIVLGYDQAIDEYQIGDYIDFLDEYNDENINGLEDSRYKIVGFVRSGDYLSKQIMKLSSIGGSVIKYYGFVTDDSIDLDYYTEVLARVKNPPDRNYYGEEYKDYVEKVRKDLEKNFEDRPPQRLNEIIALSKDEISKNEKLLEDAKKELEDAKEELAEGKDELDQAEKDILEGEIKIKEGEVDLRTARVELDDGWKKLYEGENTLKIEEGNARKKLAEGQEELENAKITLNKERAKLEDGKKKLVEAREELEKNRPKLEKAKKDLEEGQKSYQEGLDQYNKGLKEFNDKKKSILIGREVALGELHTDKSKEELEVGINETRSEINTSKENIKNYQAQLKYNQESGKEFLTEEEYALKIQELEGLIAKENSKIDQKTVYLKNLENDLAYFKKIENEGNESPLVLEYADEGLEEAQKELNKGKKELDEAKKALDEGRAEYEKGLKEFQDGEAEILDAEQEIKDGEIKIRDAEKEIKDGEIELIDGKKELEEKIRDGKKEIADNKKKLQDGEVEYLDGIEDLKQARIDLEEGKKERLSGIEEYEEGKKEFEEKSKDAEKEIEIGEKKLSDAKEKISNLKTPEFMIESRNADQSYYTLNSRPRSLKILVLVFSTLALMVSSLVASTTMTRMIDERRTLIGTFKGLGYSNSTIAAKYIIFGSASGIVGGILGALFGQFILAPMIYEVNLVEYVFDDYHTLFSLGQTIFTLILAIVTTSLSSYLAVNKSLKSNAAELLRPKAPKSGIRILLERIEPLWSRMNFIQKITARNIFRYKGRMLMTITGVAACCAILILGFGMEFSMLNISRIQYEELEQYDITSYISDTIDENSYEKLVSDISEKSKYLGDAHIENLKLEITNKNTQDVSLVVDTSGNFEDLFGYRNYKNKEDLILSSKDVFITEKLAVLLGVDIGDSFEVRIDNVDYQLPVTNIIENYIGHKIFINESFYEELTGLDTKTNAFFIKLEEGVNQDEFVEKLHENSDVLASLSNDLFKDQSSNIIDSLNIIVVVIVAIAMALSIVVLYNLTNINISERIRELSTMKVLGFYPGEITKYVFRETFLLSILGILAGIGLGIVIVEFILVEFAPPNMMFGDPTYKYSILISAVLTLVFTSIVMAIMHKKLKNINMVEALKSVE